MEVGAGVEAAEEAEVAVAAEQQSVLQPQEEEEETPSSSAQNRPPLTGIGKTSTDSYQISKDICP